MNDLESLMHLNPEHLLTFAAVVREGGVAAAARRLHLTQPAVSNQLRNLQQVIGDALYRRQGRGIALTGAGQRLYPEAQRLADALSAAENLAISLGSGDSGLVRVAASQTLGAYVLPSVLAAFREQAPGVEIELESHNTRRVLERLEVCDIGLVEGDLDRALPPDWQFENLATDEIVALLRRDPPPGGESQPQPGSARGTAPDLARVRLWHARAGRAGLSYQGACPAGPYRTGRRGGDQGSGA